MSPFIKLIRSLACIGWCMTLCSCADTRGWSQSDWELAAMGVSPQKYAHDVARGQAHRRMEQMLYLGMPEEEFVQTFGNTALQTDANRPYILEQHDHRYVVVELPLLKEKARVTFDNGMLVKFERYGMGTNPWGYSDVTIFLRH